MKVSKEEVKKLTSAGLGRTMFNLGKLFFWICIISIAAPLIGLFLKLIITGFKFGYNLVF